MIHEPPLLRSMLQAEVASPQLPPAQRAPVVVLTHPLERAAVEAVQPGQGRSLSGHVEQGHHLIGAAFAVARNRAVEEIFGLDLKACRVCR
jgi:hypothetical protein